MKRILFVDDEPRILTALGRMLRSLRSDWEMVFAESGREALAQCDSAPFDVVVSDARMPGMEGSELLGEVRRRFPDAVRLILSGQCSRGSVLKSVGVAHQFLSKPCDAETLKSAVRRVCALRDQFRDEATRRAICRVQTLPSQATLHAELVERVESAAASAEEAAKIIARDVAMCAKTAQLVSSGFFGTPQRVADAAHAARLLGLETIRALVASAAFVPDGAGHLTPSDIEDLNDHSLAVARAAERIAATVTDDRTVIHDAYLAGMLHEVGALALPRGWETAASPDPGGYLLALWGLPETIVHAVSYQRAPASCPDRGFGPLVAVHVAAALLEPPDGHEGADRWSGSSTAAPPNGSPAGPTQDGPWHGPTGQLDMEYLASLGCADRLGCWRDICAACQDKGVLS